MTVRRYLRITRTPRYSLVFAAPLLLAYELLAALLSPEETGGVRNAADVIIKSAAAALVGPWGPVALGVMLVGGCLWLIARDVRRSREAPRPAVLTAMMGESVLLALVFGLVVGIVTARLLGATGLLAASSVSPIEQLGWWTRVMLSLGAGLYEELLFRVLLVGALAAGARLVLGWRPLAAGAFAALIGAAVFSAFHYVGPFGDPWQIPSFTFRFIAGVALSGIYLMRGFGITAWTHAIYDLLVLAL